MWFSGRFGLHHNYHYLHWLPVTYRINVMLSTLTYRTLYTQQPPYLSNFPCIFQISLAAQIINSQLIVPKAKLNLRKRNFFVAAPRVWNELPITLKETSETIAFFRKKEIFIPNCISTINLRLSFVLITTFARPCSRLCLIIQFCCVFELKFLRIQAP